MSEHRWSARRQSRLRRTLAIGVVLIMASVFLVRLVDLQVVSAAAFNEESANKRAVPVTIPSVRGEIVDRNGNVLATTEERYDVQLSPKNTKVNGGSFFREADDGRGTQEVTAKQAFSEIAEVTDQSASEIEQIVDDALEIDEDSDFAYVKRGIDLAALNELKALEIPWLTFSPQHVRSYPNGAVGGNIIGFAGYGEDPQSGVELSQDACLAGTDGSEVYERGADGVALPGSVVVTDKAVNGGTVQLTIDRDLQWQMQQTINRKVQEYSAEWGYLVVMDATTGELLAVAEDGSVDPGDVSASDPNKREARSFVAPYEPGSTFKTITMAALIDQGKATPLTQNVTPWTWSPEANVSFKDSWFHGEMPWTLTGILVESSNVGTSMVGSRLDESTRYDYLRKFGIGESTQAGMPMEDSGLLHPVEDWDRQTSYTTMFGQGLSSTIVQTAGVYQTIANDGKRVPPSIVASCTTPEGKVTKPDHGDPVQVVTKDTADEVTRMLETLSVENWVAKDLEIPGYRLAGKTGTAEQSNGAGGYRSDYVNTFVGFFPVDDPQYVIATSLGYPKSGNGSIGVVTSFKEAAESTIRAFSIPPSTGEPELYPVTF